MRKLVLALIVTFGLATATSACIVRTGPSRGHKTTRVKKSPKHTHRHCHRKGHNRKVCHTHPHRHPHH